MVSFQPSSRRWTAELRIRSCQWPSASWKRGPPYASEGSKRCVAFGTDDAKERRNRDAAYLEGFLGEYNDMLQSVSEKYSRVILVVPPLCDEGTQKLNKGFINEELLKLLPGLADGQGNVDVANLFTKFGAFS